MQLKTYLIYCLILYLVLVIRTLLYIEKEKQEEQRKRDGRNRKRENHGEGCRRPLRPFLASLLFRLMPPPSTPSPAAHQVAPPTKEREERAPCPALGGCHRHHIATDRPATRRAAPRAVCHPSHLASLLFRMLSSPSAPSPAAHRVASPTKEREERAPCPALGGCHRHHLATDRPATRRVAPRSVCHPARLVLFPVPSSRL